MAHQCPVRGTSCKYPNPGPFGNCWSRTTCRVWQNGPLAGRQQRPHRRLAAKNARPRSPLGQRRRRQRRARTRAGSVFSPRHRRAGRRGTAIPSAATDACTTTSSASSTQPVLTRRRTRSASTAAANSAVDPVTAATTSTAAPAAAAAAAAAGGRGGRGSAAKRCQLQQDS